MTKLTAFLFVFVLLLVSCKKDKEENTQVPAWLKSEFELVDANFQQGASQETSMCQICDVEVYQLNGKKYYNLYCGLWSCMYCHFYDEDGVLVEWQQEEWEDFMANKKLVQTISTCDL